MSAVTLAQVANNPSNNGDATTVSNVLNSASTTGNLLVAGVWWTYQTPPTLTGVTDGTNAFAAVPGTLVTQSGGSGGWVVATQLFYVANITGLATDTVTGNTYAELQIWELTPGQFDQAVTNNATSVAAPTNCDAGTITPSANGAFGIAIAQMNDGGAAANDWTAHAGWTKDSDDGLGVTEWGGAHIAQATAAPLTMGLQHVNDGAWCASGATFVPVGSTPPGVAMFSVSDPSGTRLPGIH